MKNKRLYIILAVIGIILLIPLVAMQFTEAVNWSLLDFIAAGLLLLATGFMLEIILRKVKSTKFRIAICLALLILFILIWTELAVGIFGTPLAGS
jgi:uncharacterized membrane protein